MGSARRPHVVPAEPRTATRAALGGACDRRPWLPTSDVELNVELLLQLRVLDHLAELLVGQPPVMVLQRAGRATSRRRGQYGRGRALGARTRSPCAMVRSTSCCSCVSVRLVPTMALRMWKRSPLEMNPSPLTSYMRKANLRDRDRQCGEGGDSGPSWRTHARLHARTHARICMQHELNTPVLGLLLALGREYGQRLCRKRGAVR